MQEAIDVLFGPAMIMALTIFFIVSYVIVGLLTWSIHKPLKYLGIPVIIVGFVSFGLKALLELAIKVVKLDEVRIIEFFIEKCGPLLIKFALIGIISGVLMIVLYVVLDKQIKARKREKRLEEREEKILEKKIKERQNTTEEEPEDTKDEEIS